MTVKEFSDEFDVLYNSITSNQAPGLDEYEKSVFLTKAQDEIIKSYFNPRTNKTQEGFDDNEKRQIDFSMIMRSKVYAEIVDVAKPLSDDLTPTPGAGSGLGVPDITKPILSPFTESFFDLRDNTKAVSLEDDILMFVNEYVEVNRNDVPTRLTILPINYTEYSRLMSKPYKRPTKSQAWRLLDNSSGYKMAEIIVGPNDEITKYVIRYVKRPRAIRLDNFDDVTIDGDKTVQSCELDPILHPEILQRAVELAKAAYTGDLQSQIALGQASQTNMGIVQSSR